jgi:23S rRNA (guanine2445-N2)-methyltransferase / 23S rRNA (guanine2069-N7)-methyltransferase
MSTHRYVATVARGAELPLQQELASFGIQAKASVAAVYFQGPLEAGLRVCLHSRIASRVLLELAHFPVRSADELFRSVKRIPWHEHIDPDRSIAVDFLGRNGFIRDGRFGALKTKDGIVDRLRNETGRRPDVDPKHPDLRINVHLRNKHATVALDLSGEPLHLRGKGRATGPAPLRETLAAALIWMTGWPQQRRQLVDPMCGSATLLSEAAGWAAGLAPGIHRERWGFQAWRQHDPYLWRALVLEAKKQRRKQPTEPFIRGLDRAESSLGAARSNLMRYGLEGWVELEAQPLDSLAVQGEPGVMITNPPYGARLGEVSELEVLYAQLGDIMRHRLLGWDCWIFCGEPALAKRVGLRASSRHPIANGPIDCRLLHYPISSEPPRGERRG